MKSKFFINTALALVISSCTFGSLIPVYSQTVQPINVNNIVSDVSDGVVKVYVTKSNDNDQFTPLFKNFFINKQDAPPPPISVGSGFIIKQDGIVITNNHVIEDKDIFYIILKDTTILKATLIGKDPKLDIAVLKIQSDREFKTVKLGNSDTVQVGDSVIAIGNPFNLDQTVTTGIVSALHRDISGPLDDFIQTSAPINHGNSGGPLFNSNGEVIGINTSIFSENGGGNVGVGFSNPTNNFLPTVEQILYLHEIRRGHLGILVQSIDEIIKDGLNLVNSNGAIITFVDDNSPASDAGLQIGDVIITIDGNTIKSNRDLSRLIASYSAEKQVIFTIIRDGKQLDKSINIKILSQKIT